MKRFLVVCLFVLVAMSAIANEYVVLSISNSTPSNPKVSVNMALIKRNAYQFDLYWLAEGTNALDISGREVNLNWKAKKSLYDSPVNQEQGVVVDGPGGHGRVYLDRDVLKVEGDTRFEAVAQDSTNRVAFFWEVTVYEAVEQQSDEINIPSGISTNYYTTTEIDALLASYEDAGTAAAKYLDVAGDSMAANLGMGVYSITNINTNGVVFSDGETVTSAKVGQWETSYGWGDHGVAGYAANTGLVAASNSLQAQITANDEELTNALQQTGGEFYGKLTGSDSLVITTGIAVAINDSPGLLASVHGFSLGTSDITNGAGGSLVVGTLMASSVRCTGYGSSFAGFAQVGTNSLTGYGSWMRGVFSGDDCVVSGNGSLAAGSAQGPTTVSGDGSLWFGRSIVENSVTANNCWGFGSAIVGTNQYAMVIGNDRATMRDESISVASGDIDNLYGTNGVAQDVALLAQLVSAPTGATSSGSARQMSYGTTAGTNWFYWYDENAAGTGTGRWLRVEGAVSW